MSYQIQQQIKNNAADLRNYVEDLYDWEQQMSVKEKQKKNSTAAEVSKVVPVRGSAQVQKVDNETKPEDNAEKTKLKRDANTVGDYYKAWDNFDIDKEIEDLDAKHKDEEMSGYVNPYAAMTSTKPRAAPRAQIRINSQRSPLLDVNSLKDKANLLYSSCNFKGAEELYQECIEKIKQYTGALTQEENLLFATIYSNRAMTLLKLQEYGKAEADATSALQLQPKHVKSFLRRGTARKKLLKLKDALADFQSVVKLQSDNTEAQGQIAVVNKLLTDKKDKAIHELLVESQDTEEFITIPVGDISGSDIDIDDNDDDDEDEDANAKNSKFAHLKVIDKPAEPNDENSSDDEKNNRDINFNKKVEDLDLNKKTSYHKDEVPSHSILHNSHDLGHLVKAIDTKPIRHSAKTEEEISGNVSGVVKFGGEEIPVQSHTPVHNRQPRNSILKNSPLVQENFHAQIKDIDGKLLGHSKFKEDDKDEESKREASDVKSNGSEESNDDEEDQEESFSVRFKKEKEEIESSTAPRHSFSVNGSTPKKHILKSNLEDATQLNQLHQKYFTDKSPTHGQNAEASFGYQALKNIDGKQVQHDRSPRNKLRFAEEDVSGDDKKVHFGGVQNVAKTNEQQKKELKPRHSILKTQGTGGITQETPVAENEEKKDSLPETKEAKEKKIERAIEQGVQKIKETIIESASSSKTELTASKFLSEWSHLKGDNSARLQYLENVSAGQILTIFKEGMEIEVISEILGILGDSPILAKAYLFAFPQLKRFKLTVSCLSSQEKQSIKELIEKLSLSEEESNSIKALYKIK